MVPDPLIPATCWTAPESRRQCIIWVSPWSGLSHLSGLGHQPESRQPWAAHCRLGLTRSLVFQFRVLHAASADTTIRLTHRYGAVLTGLYKNPPPPGYGCLCMDVLPVATFAWFPSTGAGGFLNARRTVPIWGRVSSEGCVRTGCRQGRPLPIPRASLSTERRTIRGQAGMKHRSFERSCR